MLLVFIVLVQPLITIKKIKYRIVGKDEADVGKNLIYFKSPIGKALIGKKINDLIKEGKISKERLNQIALRTSFKNRKVRNLHIQEQPLMVRKPDLVVIVGNSRTQGALDEFGPDELMWIEWHEQGERPSKLQEIRDRSVSYTHLTLPTILLV